MGLEYHKYFKTGELSKLFQDKREMDKRLSPQALDFIFRLMRIEPNDRMTVAEALGHPWLREGEAIPRHVHPPKVIPAELTLEMFNSVQRKERVYHAGWRNPEITNPKSGMRQQSGNSTAGVSTLGYSNSTAGVSTLGYGGGGIRSPFVSPRMLSPLGGRASGPTGSSMRIGGFAAARSPSPMLQFRPLLYDRQRGPLGFGAPLTSPTNAQTTRGSAPAPGGMSAGNPYARSKDNLHTTGSELETAATAMSDANNR